MRILFIIVTFFFENHGQFISSISDDNSTLEEPLGENKIITEFLALKKYIDDENIKMKLKIEDLTRENTILKNKISPVQFRDQNFVIKPRSIRQTGCPKPK
jgi:hypothetical protein